MSELDHITIGHLRRVLAECDRIVEQEEEEDSMPPLETWSQVLRRMARNNELPLRISQIDIDFTCRSDLS